MKKVLSYGLLVFFISVGCEDVIEIDTPSEEPRLAIDGLIRVNTDESFLPVRIKVTLTDNFFGKVPVTNLDNIVIFIEEYDEGIVSRTTSSTLAEESPGSGIYIPDPDFFDDQRIPTFVTERERVDFKLLLEYRDRQYFAETTYIPAVPISSVLQGRGKLFSEDDTEIIVTFADDPNRRNYYVFDFDFDEFQLTDDRFYNGQLFQFSYFYDRQFETGTAINIKILGADKNFYDYMNQLIEQSEEAQGVFQTPAATIKGNVFDVTGIDNVELSDNVERPEDFPLGYFAVVQEYQQSLTIR